MSVVMWFWGTTVKRFELSDPLRIRILFCFQRRTTRKLQDIRLFSFDWSEYGANVYKRLRRKSCAFTCFTRREQNSRPTKERKYLLNAARVSTEKTRAARAGAEGAGSQQRRPAATHSGVQTALWKNEPGSGRGPALVWREDWSWKGLDLNRVFVFCNLEHLPMFIN